MKNYFISLFLITLILTGCVRKNQNNLIFNNKDKGINNLKQADLKIKDLNQSLELSEAKSTGLEISATSTEKSEDEQRANDGLFPKQKITKLLYKERFQILLIDESLPDCYLLDAAKRAGCSFSIILKDLKDGWETKLIDSSVRLTYLGYLSGDDLHFTAIHLPEEQDASDYRSENLHYVVKEIQKRINELQSAFANFDVSTAKFLNFYYSKDKNYSYFKQWGPEHQPQIISSASSSSFGVIPNYAPLAMDNQSVYFYGDRIDFKPKDLRSINRDYIVNDSKAIYLGPAGNGRFYLKIISPINISKIQNVKNDFHEYIKDDITVFHKGNVLEGADAATFKCLSPSHCKDKNHVYYGGKIIKDADPATFEVIDTFKGYDKNHVYLEDRVI